MIASGICLFLTGIPQARFWSLSVHRALATTTVLVGIAGQLSDSLLSPTRNAIFVLHVLFALGLFFAIVARFGWELRRTHLHVLDIAVFNRQLKRQVYVLLYGLAAVKELLIIGIYSWRGGVFVVGDVHIGGAIATCPVLLPPFDDFKNYAICGVASIFLIRFLLVIYGQRLTPRR